MPRGRRRYKPPPPEAMETTDIPLGCSLTLTKWIMCAINVVFMLFAVALIVIGANAEVGLVQVNIPAGLALGVAFLGCVIFAVCAFGLYGAKEINICYLKVYFVLMIIIFVVEILAATISFLATDYLDKALSSAWSTGSPSDLYYTESQFKCCGYLNPQDRPSNGTGTTCDPTWTSGCKSFMIDFIQSYIKGIQGVLVVVLILQVIACGGAYLLIQGISQLTEQAEDAEEAEYEERRHRRRYDDDSDSEDDRRRRKNRRRRDDDDDDLEDPPPRRGGRGGGEPRDGDEMYGATGYQKK
eukprot:gnl/Hemi2/12762_TR4360_c0_g2_i1.p1 gnl/Hemi2/12762_TR4360_c0_g2~~gnl/Hemi2/12762_TR4360_c0_g2_i1.p1  ORF type:complete len:298 (-),score=82.60 gnl/Hemi2/12762_TR4360_c0_g2_i1:245-1138(-)